MLRFEIWFLNPFALSVRRSVSKTNVSKGTGFKIIFLWTYPSIHFCFAKTLRTNGPFNVELTLLSRKNHMSSRKLADFSPGRTILYSMFVAIIIGTCLLALPIAQTTTISLIDLFLPQLQPPA